MVQCVALANEAANEWINLGKALGLEAVVLASIHQRHGRSALACFADMFDQWLQLSTPQHPANWSTFITALQSIDKNTVARNIQRKYVDFEALHVATVFPCLHFLLVILKVYKILSY